MGALSSLVYAASGLVSLTQAIPSLSRSADYKTYVGDGSPSDGWPSEDQWLDFDTL